MANQTQPLISAPRFEHHANGFGLSVERPRISWKLSHPPNAEVKNWIQHAYEIELKQLFPVPADTATTYEVRSSDSVLVPWPLDALSLTSRAAVQVRVRARDTDNWTSWSDPSVAEAGLLSLEEWGSARAIAPARSLLGQEDDAPRKPWVAWRRFDLPRLAGEIVRARLYITALGAFDATINGRSVGDEVLAPGWTSYNHRLEYRAHDVLEHLREGADNKQVLRVEVAEGWFSGRLGFHGGRRGLWGKEQGLLARLEVTFSQGESWSLVTSAANDGEEAEWTFTPSARIAAEIYDGEAYDTRLADAFETYPIDAETIKAKELPLPTQNLIVTDNPPLRITERRPAEKVWLSPAGKTLIDFGENVVGVVEISDITLTSGSELRIRHAEVLENGELGIRPLRFARAEDVLIGNGSRISTHAPRFTFHGFRYAEIEGWPSSQLPAATHFTALVTHTDLTRTGYFSCSNANLNRLCANIDRSLRGNFFSIPTDCPQRDERLGWTGDIQAFAPTACWLYDCAGFLGSWLKDLQAEQLEPWRNGVPPLVCPDVIAKEVWPPMPQAVWDDATVLVPWAIYKATGDERVLADAKESMLVWLTKGVDREAEALDSDPEPSRLWTESRWQLGDWLDPSAPPDNPADATTDDVLVADAFLVHTTRVFASILSVLSRSPVHSPSTPASEVRIWSSHASNLSRKWQHKYLTPYGNVSSSTQTALSLATLFHLHPDPTNPPPAFRPALHKLLLRANHTLKTGFAGTPALLPALCDLGMPQQAYAALLQEQCPGWMYPVTMGATSCWERWDSMLPDGRINEGEMTSFNHFSYGSVGAWIFSTVGGLSVAEVDEAAAKAGGELFSIAPLPGGDLTSATASLDSAWGKAEVSWRLEELEDLQTDEHQPPDNAPTLPGVLEREKSHGRDGLPSKSANLKITVTIPPGARARVTLPSARKAGRFERAQDGTVIGSGTHVFVEAWTPDEEWPVRKFSPF